MNYKEALAYIHGTHKFGIKNCLENIKTLLSFMGDPQKKLKFVHVAGTNGKGSTCTFINNILISSGYKTGLYTSPYLINFNERIRVNNIEISDEKLSEITEFVINKVADMLALGFNHPTEFEIVTAIGFKYFCDMDCNIVVLEVGLGGQFDATNVIPYPEVAVITSISYDHTNILGNEISQIAFEKAGIIKPNSSVVMYPQKEIEADSVISNICQVNDSTLYKVDALKIVLKSFDKFGQLFDYDTYKDLKISLLGNHQLLNAATAIEVAKILREKGFNIRHVNIEEGLIKSSWPGRFEILSRDPLVIIDGAHNIDGATVLNDTIKTFFPEHSTIVILGLLKDKDVNGILSPIFKCAKNIITVKPLNDRALDAQELADIIVQHNNDIPVQACLSYQQAILEAKKLSQSMDNPLIVACGSLYYIGEIRKIILG